MTIYDKPVAGKLDGNALFAGREQLRTFPTILLASALKTAEAGQRAAQMILAVAAGKQQNRDAIAIASERHGENSLTARALQASIGSTGGYLIPTELSSELIDLLRPRTAVRRMVPLRRQISIPRGNLSINRQNAGANVGYMGEGQSTAYTQESVGQITLQAKKVKAIVPISNDLIRSAEKVAEMMVRDDLVKQLAVLEDQNFLRGAGVSWGPKGLKYLASNTTHATTSSYSVTTAISDLAGMVITARKCRGSHDIADMVLERKNEELPL